MVAVNQLLSLSDDLICIIDEAGRILEANNNLRKLLQSTPVGLELVDLIEEEHEGTYLRTFFDSPEMSMIKIQSCRLKSPGGARIWVDLRIKKIPGQEKYWCLLRDISVRKFRNTVLDTIADACNIGYWKYHSGFEELLWSDKVFEIFEKSPHFYRPHITDFRLSLPEEVLNELRSLKTSHFDITYKMMIENRTKWIRIKGKKEVFPDESYEYQGMIQDVTLEVLKEKVHLSSNIELSSFEKGLDQFSIVARTDSKGRIIAANQEFCRLSKYTEEELIGKDHRIVNSGHHPKEFFAEMWRCIKEGKNWRGEIKNRAKDGSFYWVDTIIIPIRDSNEDLIEILSFRYEITKLKEVEEENRVLREQLELLSHFHSGFAWSFDFVEKRFSWNSRIHEVFDCPKESSFDHILSLMSSEDQNAILTFIEDVKQTHFIRNVAIAGKEVQLSFKAIRNSTGQMLKVEGVCSVMEPGSSIRPRTQAVA